MSKKIIPKKFWEQDSEIQGLSVHEFLQKLRAFGEKENIPNISPIAENLLVFMLQSTKPKRVLEMGCANGYSSIVIAQELKKWSGKLLSCDVSKPSLESAQINAAACSLLNIEFRLGNVLETVKEQDGFFDFIFIDAQKSWTHKFFTFASQRLNQKGVIVVDDTQKFPDKMKSFHSLIKKEQERWHFFTVPEKNDAIMVFVRK